MKIIKLLLVISSVVISMAPLRATELNKEKTPERCDRQKWRHARHWRCPDLQKSMKTTETDDTKKKRNAKSDGESLLLITEGDR